MDDPPDCRHEVTRIVEPAVGIVDDPAPLVRLDVVAVDEPAEQRAAVDLVLVRLGRDAGQVDVVVDDQRRAVVDQAHLPGAQAVLLRGCLGTLRELDLKRVFLTGFVGQVQFTQAPSGIGKRVEVGRQGHARQVFR